MTSTEMHDPLYKNVVWVWFDLDDTLIDFHTNSRLAHRALFDEEKGFGGTYTHFDEWLEAYETHNVELWSLYADGRITQDFLRLDRFKTPLIKKWVGKEEELDALCRHLDTRYLDMLAEQKTLVDGARETLIALREKGFRTGVLSNGFTDVQHRKIKSAGLDGLIDCIVLSDDIGITKPDPRLYLHAMARVNLPNPDAHLMVGDNLSTDIKGAAAARWKSIFFDPRDKEAGSPVPTLWDTRIRSLTDLQSLFF